MKKNKMAIFYLTCDHFRDMTHPILALHFILSIENDNVECANDVVHLHNIEW